MQSLRYYPSAPITAALRQFVPWQRPTRSAIRLDYLIIGGGGAGRWVAAATNAGGGGGAGGYLTSLTNELNGGGFPAQPPLYVYKDLFLTVTVGAGGAGGTQPDPGNAGTNSALFQILLGSTLRRALGGATGQGAATVSFRNGGGTATAAQAGVGGDASDGENSMYAGGNSFTSATASLRAGGGGGGAGAVGSNGVSGVGGNGGAGRASSITGTSVTRAGGGGGSRPTTATSQGAGGSGGGGAAAYNATATSGTVNTGSGGGAASTTTSFTSGAGGSGIVILRHSTIYPQATTTGSPTITTSGGFRIYTFTGSGSILF